MPVLYGAIGQRNIKRFAAYEAQRIVMELLKPTTFVVEGAVIGTCALAAAQIATAHGGDISACLPILTIAAMECMRVPVAMKLPHLRPLGATLGVLLLIAITPLTFEGMSLAFEQFMHQRVLAVAKAEDAMQSATQSLDDLKSQNRQRTDEIDRRKQALADAEKHQVELGKQPVQLQEVPDAVSCKSRQRGSRICNAGSIEQVIKANSKTQQAHTDQLKVAESAVKEARQALSEAAARPETDLRSEEKAFAEAKKRLDFEKGESVMHRAAAAWFGVSISSLSSEQFETFKKWAMYGLAGAAATVTMLGGFVSAAATRDGTPSKLNRAFRGLFLARRRKLRQIVPTIKVEHRDREVFVHVPVDAATGQILDRRPNLHLVGSAAE